jgi:hypothetical protein
MAPGYFVITMANVGKNFTKRMHGVCIGIKAILFTKVWRMNLDKGSQVITVVLSHPVNVGSLLNLA